MFVLQEQSGPISNSQHYYYNGFEAMYLMQLIPTKVTHDATWLVINDRFPRPHTFKSTPTFNPL